MALRTGAEFLEGLRDGRSVWLAGEQVKDVATHPGLAEVARTLAEIYDLQHDPEFKDALAIPSPLTGNPISASYLLPTNHEELTRRKKLIQFWSRRSGGVAGRLPDYQAIINVGLYDHRGIFAQEDPQFEQNVVNWFQHMTENDLLQTHAFADPPRDRSRPPSDLEYLKIVERRPDGIVIRGAKSVSTIAPYANEFLGLTPFRPGILPDEVLYFAVPLNTKGLHIVCRNSLVPREPEDHPLAPYWDEMDASIVFDDVFIPSDRIFFIRKTSDQEPRYHGNLFYSVISYPLWHILVRATIKTEVLLGICSAMVDYLGTANRPEIQLALAQVGVYLEALKALAIAAEQNYIPSPSGLAVPNPTQITAGRIMVVERHAQILQMLRELSGSGILMSPNTKELADPDVGPFIRKYFVGKDERALERFRMLKLAWEYACDSFGGRQLLFEIYNAGGINLNLANFIQNYDVSSYVQIAKDLAGITSSSETPLLKRVQNGLDA
ncbi:MAG TPA: 4-hydroxyphenylacetate 3-hydroxylase N-terminal domain-containing protein [Dehalococcoidia bacterium]|nr:4-hydroxyphenylacetate 3-hydroxylase N-terminal domain-containing protein [Dehalococcoidia bacterium]